MINITYAHAEAVLLAARTKASAIGSAASISIQDRGGHAVAFLRMDGAFLGSIDIAEKKARTSVLFELETQDMWPFSQAKGPAHGMELTNGVIVTFPGGIPLKAPDNTLIGAIGVSGGTPDIDYAIAQAGAAALAFS